MAATVVALSPAACIAAPNTGALHQLNRLPHLCVAAAAYQLTPHLANTTFASGPLVSRRSSMASLVSCTAVCSSQAGDVRSSMRPASKAFSTRNRHTLVPQVSALAAMVCTKRRPPTLRHSPLPPHRHRRHRQPRPTFPEQAAQSPPHTALFNPHRIIAYFLPIATCRLLLSAAGSCAARWQRRRPRVRRPQACRQPGTSPSASLLMRWP